ncbi:hypothetical protein TraAM80_01305 [Trypanosoma rangeli]|uniref:Uncharacterized protein n=1 Tax=Trypanosoma rangeli TaxID=5698 RepID=A0A3R7LB19_TRYRA|nr:uncharacterized protein TraAM80_01305 [Trypanosoma rangeli]RNF10744.1 hypothetical protein TraAM80_01305 [Trypanosoma rangeli]|eukprot:RNF10744.1 hypothetical protein TraAM80_01305 [Trypanosoma rangeli]
MLLPASEANLLQMEREASLNRAGRMNPPCGDEWRDTHTPHFTSLRRSSLWRPAPSSMEPRCEAHHFPSPEQFGETNDAVQAPRIAGFTPFLHFLPVGVVMRCVRALQRLPDAVKVVVWFTMGSARRVVEGSTRLGHHLHPVQQAKLSLVFAVGATVRCCRGALQVALFQLHLSVAGLWRAVAASELAGAHAMTAAGTAVLDALDEAVG